MLFCRGLAEEIIVAALAEVAVEAAVGIVVGDYVAATLAGGQVLLSTIRAEVDIGSLVVGRLGFRQFFAAIFTDNRFHN